MVKTNKALFRGRIVSIKGDNKNGYMTVVCPSIIRTRKNGKFETSVRENFPTLSFNKDTKTEDVMDNFKKGDYVTVTAHIQSYIRQDTHSGETYANMSAYIDEVEHTKSDMEEEFGVKGRSYPEGYNRVFLCGEVSGLSKRNKGALAITLDMSDRGRRNRLDLIYFNAPESAASDFPIGSVVNVVAEMQTINTNEQANAFRPYQSLVVLEMSKSDQKPDGPVQMSDAMTEMMTNAKASIDAKPKDIYEAYEDMDEIEDADEPEYMDDADDDSDIMYVDD